MSHSFLLAPPQKTALTLAPVIRRHADLWLVTIALTVLFGSVVFGVDRLAFRDVSHFYTPLYKYVAQRTTQEWLPLWNPLCATGMPLVGETTTAVFYPIRFLVFKLPISATSCIGVYVVVHLLIACATATWLARRYQSIDGLKAGHLNIGHLNIGDLAPLVGILYSLGGSVFFLHTNLPFLVGAAWLPLALGGFLGRNPGVTGHNQIATMSRRDIITTAFALAMMVLGGDPQTALHVVLVAAAVLMYRSFRERDLGIATSTLLKLCCVGGLAACLAAPQIVASLSWSQLSRRSVQEQRTNWIEPPAPGSRHSEAYEFSLPPWHLTELVTPWASGRLFPVHQRISQAMPGDGRVWTPTIYMGALGFLGLLSLVLCRRLMPFDVWAGLAVLSFLLAMGHFGFVWVIQQFGFLNHVDSAVGGPYWLLHQFVPTYDSFRYPSKWLPFFSLAVAMVTGRWAACLFANENHAVNPSTAWLSSRRVFLIAAAVIGTSLLAIIMLRLSGWQLSGAENVRDEYWGPLNWNHGLREIGVSLVHSAVVLSLLYGLILLHQKGSGLARRTSIFLLMLLVTADLLACNLTMVAKANIASETLLLTNHGITGPTAGVRTMRMQNQRSWPAQWQSSISQNRIQTASSSERLTSFGRWHLDRGMAVFNGMASIRSQDVDLFWKATASQTRAMSSQEREAFWNSIHDWLGLDAVIDVDPINAIEIEGESFPGVSVRYLQHEADGERTATWEPTSIVTFERFAKLLEAIHEQAGNHDPIISGSDDSAPSATGLSVRPFSDSDDDTFTTQRHQIVTRPVYQDGHWFAELVSADTQEVQRLRVHKVDFLKQGVVVPPGRWQLSFRYRPWWIAPTIGLAAITWIGILCCWLIAFNRKRRSAPGPVKPAL